MDLQTYIFLRTAVVVFLLNKNASGVQSYVKVTYCNGDFHIRTEKMMRLHRSCCELLD